MIKIEKYLEVIQNILPLLDTMEEGLIHIKKQVQELRYEESLGLLEDIVMGIISIKDAIQPILPKLVGNNIEVLGNTLKESINMVVKSYENQKEAEMEKQVEQKVLIALKNWRTELERVLIPYIAS